MWKSVRAATCRQPGNTAIRAGQRHGVRTTGIHAPMPTDTPDRNVVVILAGGVGQRMGLEGPKQLLKVAGRTILEHTIAAFEAHPAVDEILLAMAEGHLDSARQIVKAGG